MIFINTRPQSRAQPLTQALQASGLTVYDLPLLELSALPLTADEMDYQANLVQSMTAYQALVVISPTAASMGLEVCPLDFKPSCPVIAVGNVTADVLKQAGWHVLCPQESSNESMMQMDVIAGLQTDDSVLIWRGRGGRRLLVNHLQQRQVKVDAIEWYVRQLPQDTDKKFRLMQTQIKTSSMHKPSNPIVLVSSGEAFNYWQVLVAQSSSDSNLQSLPNPSLQTPKHNQLSNFSYLTFGKRLTDRLHHLQLTCERLDDLSVLSVKQGINVLVQSSYF